MTAYYNEIDTFAAAWLRELIKAGHIAPGEVDTRSIADVSAADLVGFTQCHFFAGIGVWSYALRQAGWPDGRPVWTGSCPCQPFSSAGKGKGFKDERHLWPAWYRLIRKCRPAVIFGEQVAAAAGSHLQRVPNGATNLRFPSEWERRLEMGVQEVLCHEEVEESLSGESLRLEVQKGAQGERFNPPCEVTGREKGCSFQSRHVCGRDTAKDRLGFLRSNGPTVQSRQREDLGQPFFGQDNTGRRICLLQHADCMPCCQQCYGRLGGAKDSGYGEWHFGKKKRDVEQSFEKARRMLEEEDASTWLQLIQNDLGRSDYTVGSCIAPAAGFGAPHIRQRLYWVSDANTDRLQGRVQRGPDTEREAVNGQAGRNGTIDRLADAECGKCEVGVPRLLQICGPERTGATTEFAGSCGNCSPGPTNGHWRDADWLLCRDGKWRATQSIAIEMADGLADSLGYSRFGDRWSLNPLIQKAENRVGRLRGYGNAINAEQAKAFIEAFMEAH